MTPFIPTRLVLDLEHDGDSIAGSVTDPSGVRIPFSGWLALAAAIERLAGDADRAAA